MIGVTQAEAVMTIEMQRPERRNALNSELVEELREAIQKAGDDGSTRAIVLTGQGTVFCAGADLSGDAFAADYPDRLIELHKVMDAVPVPIIGAINGPAIGAGLQLAMQCDLRVAAPDAFFQFPTSKYGLALDNWSIRRLSSLVGHGRARAMLLTAEKLSAEAALQTGMANRIGTLADAQAWAAEVAGLAPLAIQHAKRVLNDDGAIEEAWPVHKELFDKAWSSQDVVEAQVARIEKRPLHNNRYLRGARIRFGDREGDDRLNEPAHAREPILSFSEGWERKPPASPRTYRLESSEPRPASAPVFPPLTL